MSSFTTQCVAAVAACLMASLSIAADGEILRLPPVVDEPSGLGSDAGPTTELFAPIEVAAHDTSRDSADTQNSSQFLGIPSSEKRLERLPPVSEIGPIGIERPAASNGSPSDAPSLNDPLKPVRMPPVDPADNLQPLPVVEQPLPNDQRTNISPATTAPPTNYADWEAMVNQRAPISTVPPSMAPQLSPEASTNRWFGPPPLPGIRNDPWLVSQPAPAAEIASGTAAAVGSEALAEQPLGEAPVDISQVFLRQSSSLLGQGVLQTEYGFTYSWQQADVITILPDSMIELERVRERQLQVPLTARYGWSDKLEIFCTLPVGVANFERSNSGANDFTTRGGLGDISAGFLWQICQQTECSPDLIYSMQCSAPTGSTPFGPSVNTASLGSGFWSISANLNAVKSYDPVVLFGGIGYRHEFENEFDGLIITPGETFSYSFGMGMSLNDDLAVSAELFGEFTSAALVNDVGIPNSTAEPILLQFSITRRKCSDQSVQPFVAFGLTEDAPDVFLGVFFIRTRDTRWKCEE